MIITCLLPHHPDNRETGYSNILAGLFLSLHLLQQAYIYIYAPKFFPLPSINIFFRRNVKEEKGGSELHKRSLQVREMYFVQNAHLERDSDNCVDSKGAFIGPSTSECKISLLVYDTVLILVRGETDTLTLREKF